MRFIIKYGNILERLHAAVSLHCKMYFASDSSLSIFNGGVEDGGGGGYGGGLGRPSPDQCYLGFVETVLGMQSFQLKRSMIIPTHFSPDSLRLDDELQFIFSFCERSSSNSSSSCCSSNGSSSSSSSRSSRNSNSLIDVSSSFTPSSTEARAIIKIIQENTSIAQISKMIEDLANATILKYNLGTRSAVYNPSISHSSQLLIAHIEDIGLGFIESINRSMDVIKLRVPDGHGRIHIVEAILPADYPRSVRQLTLTLTLTL